MKIQCTKYGIDKIYHLLAGENVALLALFILVGVIVLLRPVSSLRGALIILSATLLVAIGKELYDVYRKKTFFDPIDVLFTELGSVPIVALWIFISRGLIS